MRQIKAAVLGMMLLTAGANLFAQSDVKEELVVPLSNPGKPYTLKLHQISGSIRVTGYSGKEIIINVSSDGHSRKEKDRNSESGGMRKISTGNGYEVKAREDNNTVRIESDNPTRTLNYELKVPQDATLRLATVNGGTIEVNSLRGEIEVSNVNGEIKLAGVSGNVVANTVNGDLVVTFNSVDGKTPMAFSTLNGKIDVTLPASTKANFKVKSDMGEVYSDFDMEIDKSQPQRNKTSQSGLYKISVNDWVYAKINGGGPEIMMKTMHGNIYIRKAK
jgi:hypothetical protein